jgi:hypothetical protein
MWHAARGMDVFQRGGMSNAVQRNEFSVLKLESKFFLFFSYCFKFGNWLLQRLGQKKSSQS